MWTILPVQLRLCNREYVPLICSDVRGLMRKSLHHRTEIFQRCDFDKFFSSTVKSTAMSTGVSKILPWRVVRLTRWHRRWRSSRYSNISDDESAHRKPIKTCQARQIRDTPYYCPTNTQNPALSSSQRLTKLPVTFFTVRSLDVFYRRIELPVPKALDVLATIQQCFTTNVLRENLNKTSSKKFFKSLPSYVSSLLLNYLLYNTNGTEKMFAFLTWKLKHMIEETVLQRFWIIVAYFHVWKFRGSNMFLGLENKLRGIAVLIISNEFNWWNWLNLKVLIAGHGVWPSRAGTIYCNHCTILRECFLSGFNWRKM